MEDHYRRSVSDYYDYTLKAYRIFWHGDTLALHYGIWDRGTRTLREALLNTNRVLADKATVRQGERVLDAGCGVGGSAFWLAAQRGAQVTGITLSGRQLQAARETARARGLESLTEFHLKDYTQTGLADASFDLVWAIESVCHAPSKPAFLREAWRLLRPGGRLVVADGFLDRNPRTAPETRRLRNFLRGLALQDLATPEGFARDCRISGFASVQQWDYTRAIMRSARRMYRMSLWGSPLAELTTRLGLTQPILAWNNRAGIDQYHLVKAGLVSYRVFLAQKSVLL